MKETRYVIQSQILNCFLIVTTRNRGNDWMAYINDDTRWWDCGATEAEAIGKAIITHCKSHREIES